MTNIYNFSQPEILAFVMVLIRMSSFIVSWPIFGTNNLPPQVKVLFALSIALLIFPTIDKSQVMFDLDAYQMMMLSIKEAFIGLSLGFLARTFLFSISMAGQIISVVMGLSGAQLFDPTTGEMGTPIDRFQVLLVSLLFLAFNGHHVFLEGLVASFKLVPMSFDLINIIGFQSVGQIVQEVMEIGVKLSAPVLIAITVMNIMMAIIGRAVPQINVLITSLPVNILVGFMVMIFAMPMVLGQVEGLIGFSAEWMFKILKTY